MRRPEHARPNPANGRGLTGKLALSLGVLALGLLVLEAVARLLPDPSDSIVAHRIPDPVLGWRLEPGARVSYRAGGPAVDFVYNSRGWRDVEHDIAKPRDVRRVLVLGDSFMEAFSVPLEASLARRLEAELDASGPTEVINFGVGGYGTLQQWLAFTTEGVWYEPDLVLLAFYTHNDVLDNSRTLLGAEFPATDANVRSRPFLDPSSPDWQVIPPDYASARRAFAEALGTSDANLPGPLRLLGRSALYRRYRDVRRSLGQPAAAPQNELRVPGVYACDQPPEWAEAWRLTERILVRLAEDVRASGAELVVFTVPSHLEVDPPDVPEARCLAEPPQSTRLPPTLAAHGVRFVDLLPEFRAAHAGGARLFGGDLHWTEDGHALAARVVAEALGRRSH